MSANRAKANRSSSAASEIASSPEIQIQLRRIYSAESFNADQLATIIRKLLDPEVAGSAENSLLNKVPPNLLLM